MIKLKGDLELVACLFGIGWEVLDGLYTESDYDVYEYT